MSINSKHGVRIGIWHKTNRTSQRQIKYKTINYVWFTVMSPEGHSWTENTIFYEEWGECHCSVISVAALFFGGTIKVKLSHLTHGNNGRARLRLQRMQYSRRSYIIYLSPSFFFFFWQTTLKVSQADPFNLTSLWSRSRNLDCLATSRGMEGKGERLGEERWYRDGNEAFLSKEWMN